MDMFHFFPRKQDLIFRANYLFWRRFAYIKTCFLEKNQYAICRKFYPESKLLVTGVWVVWQWFLPVHAVSMLSYWKFMFPILLWQFMQIVSWIWFYNIYIFDLRLLKKPIEPSVVHSSVNAMDHAKWRDVKTTDAFGDLIGRCY